MANKVESIQLNPLKSVMVLAIPIIILLFLDTTYSVIDLYWIKGLGQTAIICMGYIANAIYALNRLGEGIGRAVNVLISTSDTHSPANTLTFTIAVLPDSDTTVIAILPSLSK